MVPPIWPMLKQKKKNMLGEPRQFNIAYKEKIGWELSNQQVAGHRMAALRKRPNRSPFGSNTNQTWLVVPNSASLFHSFMCFHRYYTGT